MQRSVNQFEASFFRRDWSSFGGRPTIERLLHGTGDPDYFNQDFARYRVAVAVGYSRRRGGVPAGGTARVELSGAVFAGRLAK